MTESKFHVEIARTRGRVLAMGHLAAGMLGDSVRALEEDDRELAELVRQKKTDLSVQTNELEEELYRLIALYQPVAKDMRTIACSLRLISSAERIGRYGKDIANVVRNTHGDSRVPDLVRALSIPTMAGIVIGMIDDSLKAYETEDPAHDLPGRRHLHDGGPPDHHAVHELPDGRPVPRALRGPCLQDRREGHLHGDRRADRDTVGRREIGPERPAPDD